MKYAKATAIERSRGGNQLTKNQATGLQRRYDSLCGPVQVRKVTMNPEEHDAYQRALIHDKTLRKMAVDSKWDIRQTAIVTSFWPGYSDETVANMIGCSEETVKSHRADLTRLGWLTRCRDGFMFSFPS